jgi:hypothetical protein
VGMPRIVDVMGAIVSEFRTAIAESRVRINTGRFLPDALNVYQQTSVVRPRAKRKGMSVRKLLNIEPSFRAPGS